MTYVRCRSLVVHHKVSASYITITVWPRITKFDRDIHTDPHDNRTRCDVNRYFRSAFIEFRKKLPKMPPWTVRIFVARRLAWPSQLVGFFLSVATAHILSRIELNICTCVFPVTPGRQFRDNFAHKLVSEHFGGFQPTRKVDNLISVVPLHPVPLNG